MKRYTDTLILRLSAVILAGFSILLFTPGINAQEKKKELTEKEKTELTKEEKAEKERKEQLRKKLEEINKTAERARNLFREAQEEARSKSKGILEKLKKLDDTIKAASKNRLVNKNELRKARALRRKAGSYINKYDYVPAEKYITEAFNHIAQVPYITLKVTPSLFTPDGDGLNDKLKIKTTIQSRKDIKTWNLVIYKLIAEGKNTKRVPIKTWNGDGKPADTYTWDGLWDDGKTRVDSGSSYVAVMKAVDKDQGEGFSPDSAFKTDIFVQLTSRGMKIQVSSIQFEYNSAKIPRKYDSIIKDVHRVLLNHSGKIVVIEGHSDPDGPAPYNRRLSTKRAKEIQKRLLKLGFDSERLLPFGLGETTPLTVKKDKLDLNRRVSFYLLKDQKTT